MTHDFIPSNDGKFAAWLQLATDYLNSHATGWQIPAGTMTELTALQSDFASKYETAENPATRTSVAILAKTEARKAVETKIREVLKAYVTYNPAVTDEDRRAMELPVHKTTRTPAPVATTYPDFDVDSGTIRRLILNFYDRGQKKSKAKPLGQHCAEIRWALLDTPPASLKDLINSSVDTHTPFTLEFDENERGKNVYFALCWENTRGEKGPWSEIQSAIIP
ncbi:MAG: hypothetical protein LBJ63_02300 [Prevotellaceae bacterium]|jgi:hypothetical protein|nr:hypothetical protein [Prevotellaceae bacterium]